jgi:hypothetical protein
MPRTRLKALLNAKGFMNDGGNNIEAVVHR